MTCTKGHWLESKWWHCGFAACTQCAVSAAKVVTKYSPPPPSKYSLSLKVFMIQYNTYPKCSNCINTCKLLFVTIIVQRELAPSVLCSPLGRLVCWLCLTGNVWLLIMRVTWEHRYWRGGSWAHQQALVDSLSFFCCVFEIKYNF